MRIPLFMDFGRRRLLVADRICRTDRMDRMDRVGSLDRMNRMNRMNRIVGSRTTHSRRVF